MSLVSMGHGLGAMVITPLVGLAVANWGWRPTAVISGAVVLSVAIPLSLLVRSSPENMGLLPDGDEPGAEPVTEPPDAGVVQGSPSPARDFSTREAIRTPSYWHIVIANGLRNAVHGGIIVHMVPLMVWAGRSEREAAFLIGLMAFCTLVLRPVMGWTGDRWSQTEGLCLWSRYRRDGPGNDNFEHRPAVAANSVRLPSGLLREYQLADLGRSWRILRAPKLRDHQGVGIFDGRIYSYGHTGVHGMGFRPNQQLFVGSGAVDPGLCHIRSALLDAAGTQTTC